MQSTLKIYISLNFNRRNKNEPSKKSLDSCPLISKKILVPIDVYTPQIYLSNITKSKNSKIFMIQNLQNFLRILTKCIFLRMKKLSFQKYYIYIRKNDYDYN